MTGELHNYDRWPRELSLDEQAGPAAHITRAKADALIESALLEAGFDELLPRDPALDTAALEQRIGEPTRKRSFGLWQVAAATLLAFMGIGSASAAVMWWAKREDPKPIVTQLATPKPKPKRQHIVAKVEKVEETADKEVPVLDGLTIEAQKRKAAEKRAPEDWLDEANRLRAAKQWDEADQTYARVWQESPKSQAAYVARVAAASVRLDHLHDARGALSRYRAALADTPRGPLTEEIRYGIAEAYRALGDAEKERDALSIFVHEHPGSGLAKKAKARLSQLTAP